MTALHDYTAEQQVDLLRSGKITSVELVRHYLDRIHRINPKVNAIVLLDEIGALARAKAADEAMARGEIWGPLHGLPLSIKDSFETADMLTTAGNPRFKEHRPKRHADAVQRLVDAGAIILGKSNLPFMASDLQSFNRIYGTTNNPWDQTRTPGGSSGGAAAALAAGLTPLELGSDIGGSIRTPSHFCGIYGHKPTRNIVSMRGHIPGPPGMVSQPDMSEAGPMARHASDLAFMLKIIAAPPATEAPHWKLELPKPRTRKLQEFRIGLWIDDPLGPIDDELRSMYLQLADRLREAGAQVEPVSSSMLRLERVLPVYFYLLGSIVTLGMAPRERQQIRALAWAYPLFKRWIKVTHGIIEIGRSVGQSLARWLYTSEIRERMRYKALDLFQQYDVILAPVTPTTAVRHDQRAPIHLRTIQVNGRKYPYSDQFCWIALATALGLPATSAPIGLSRQGLPVNVQIIGGHGQDLTTIAFAEALAAVTERPQWNESRLASQSSVA